MALPRRALFSLHPPFQVQAAKGEASEKEFNIGANGIVFDAAVYPVMEYGVWWPIAIGGGIWLSYELSGDE